MPTGYTNMILRGATLREYILACARAMLHLGHMRDEPTSAEIPETVEPTRYYAEKLEEAKRALAVLEAASDEEVSRMAEVAYALDLARWDELRAKALRHREAYNRMSKQVSAWQYSAELQRLRTFMLSQIDTSIEDDCAVPDRPEQMAPEKWRRREIVSLRRSIQRYTDENAEVVEAAKAKTKWLTALWAALPPEEG